MSGRVERGFGHCEMRRTKCGLLTNTSKHNAKPKKMGLLIEAGLECRDR
jgi:hypothetical protein